MWRDGIYDHTLVSLTITATANSSGYAQGFLGPVPAGYCWYLERATTWVNAARTTSTCELFVQTTEKVPANMTSTVGDRAGRQDLSTTANNDVADENSPPYLDQGYYLVAFWGGLTSGDVAQLSTQIAVHLKSLHTTSPQIMQQELNPSPGPSEEAPPTDPVSEAVQSVEEVAAAAFRNSDLAL